MTASGLACPRCGAPMVRMAASGAEHGGEAIWSCATYPKCRGTIAVTEDPVELVADRVSSAAARSELASLEVPKRRLAGWIRKARLVRLGKILLTILVVYMLARAFLGPA